MKYASSEICGLHFNHVSLFLPHSQIEEGYYADGENAYKMELKLNGESVPSGGSNKPYQDEKTEELTRITESLDNVRLKEEEKRV